jgi:hypothetical protein
MTATTMAERDEPERDATDPTLGVQAIAAISGWLDEHPAVAGELAEAVRAHTHLQELRQRAALAADVAAKAEQRAATRAAKLDPADYRILGFTAGTVLVAIVIMLDAVPLNWAAQAFGLDAAGTWLVTGILLIASIGAMAGLETTRGNARRRAALGALMVAAYLALVVLRTEFLTTVTAESPSAAVLQAFLLSAISAGLVLGGSALMGRTRPFSLARARAEEQRTRQAADTAQAAVRTAAEKMARHMGALRQILVPWALRSAAPEGADHASWAAALERAIRALFPGI